VQVEQFPFSPFSLHTHTCPFRARCSFTLLPPFHLAALPDVCASHFTSATALSELYGREKSNAIGVPLPFPTPKRVVSSLPFALLYRWLLPNYVAELSGMTRESCSNSKSSHHFLYVYVFNFFCFGRGIIFPGGWDDGQRIPGKTEISAHFSSYMFLFVVDLHINSLLLLTRVLGESIWDWMLRVEREKEESGGIFFYNKRRRYGVQKYLA